MYSYNIHGLDLLSPRPLKPKQDGLKPSSQAPSIVIEWCAQRPNLSAQFSTQLSTHLPTQIQTHLLKTRDHKEQARISKYENGGLSIEYFDCGFFYFHKSTLFAHQIHTDTHFFEAILTTQILPLISSLYRITLHGGVVVKEKSAVIYLGPEGAGKSTLTMYMSQNGLGIFSDDVAAVDKIVNFTGFTEKQFLVYPGIPEIRINDDSCHQLLDPSQIGSLTRKLAKQQIEALPPKSQTATVAAVILLSPHPESFPITKKRLSPSESFLTLLENQFRLDIWSKEIVQTEFETLSEFCSSVPFWQLDYPMSYEQLPWVAQQIQEALCTK